MIESPWYLDSVPLDRLAQKFVESIHEFMPRKCSAVVSGREPGMYMPWSFDGMKFYTSLSRIPQKQAELPGFVACCKLFLSSPVLTSCTGSYTGRDGTGDRSYVSVRHDLERVMKSDCCDYCAHKHGYSVTLAFYEAQRQHVMAPCGKKHIWPKRHFWFMPAISQQHAIFCSTSNSQRWRWERVRATVWNEGAWENGNLMLCF